MRPTNLTTAQRAEIFDKTVAKVTKDYFDPKFNGVDWPKLARERRDGVLSLTDPEAFELAMHDMVRSLGTSHTGFFHQSVRRVPARLAIGATFAKVEADGGSTWVARDVHEEGPAHGAGLKPLDVLKAINGTAVAPPNQPMFPMDQYYFSQRQQAEKIAWRILKDWVKAQIALIESGQAELAQIFMPYAKDVNGQTLFHHWMESKQKALPSGIESEGA